MVNFRQKPKAAHLRLTNSRQLVSQPGWHACRPQTFTFWQLNQPKLTARTLERTLMIAAARSARSEEMATAGTIILEIKITAEIVLAEDGKYYVDATSTRSDDTVREWTGAIRQRAQSA
jgi:hypothetical protein